jgi:hypothetical protein
MSVRCSLKAEAAARGATRYISSSPCPMGHGLERATASGSCTECLREKRRASYYRNPQQKITAREDMRQRRAADPVGVRMRQSESRLRKQYGLTRTQYEELFARQHGHCAICPNEIVSRFDEKLPMWSGAGAPDNTLGRVDHCHSTGAVRGLLCSDCNLLLGKARDSEKILLAAAGYLRESATRQKTNRACYETAQGEIAPGNRDRDSSRSRGSRRDELSPF